VCLAWCTGVLILMDPYTEEEQGQEPGQGRQGQGPDADPRPVPLQQPPPGHPERLVLDQGLSPTEADLWKRILSEGPAA
jgi:hypothetical protein